MRSIHLLTAVLLLSTAGGCVAPGDSSQSASHDDPAWRDTNATMHEQLARKALEDGRLDDAASNAREALRIQGDRQNAALVLARVQLLAGEAKDAERTCLQVLERDEACVEAWLLRGEALSAQKRFGPARQAFRSAAVHGSIQGALAQAAQSALDGEAAAAITLLDHADVRHSEDPEVLKDAAAHWLAAGDRRTAVSMLTSAATFDSDDRWLTRFLAQDAALEGGPLPQGSSIDDRLTRAAASLRRGDVKTAVELYGAMAQQAPEDADVRIALGEALLRSGDCEGAEASFRAASKLAPTASAAWLGIARAQLSSQRPDAAVATLVSALAEQPDRVAMRGMLVAAALANGDVALARAEAARVREHAPGSPLDLRCRKALAELGVQGEP
jgi:tetratricopeptide (TPR) repeat protein